MKKLLLAIFTTIGLTALQAQDISFGAKAGVNIASIEGDRTDNLDSRLSFHVGALVEFEITEKISFQPELIYSSQGTKIILSGLVDFGIDPGAEEPINLDYLNVPLMGKFYITEGFSFEVGPQIGWLLSAKANIEHSRIFTLVVPLTDSDYVDVKRLFKGIDFGANVGLGYKLESGLLFGARYNLGLSNITDNSNDSDFKQTNAVIQVSIGYQF